MEEVSMLLIDGQPRLICNDCGHRLHEGGLTVVVDSFVIDDMRVTLYEIVPPLTTDDCKKFVALAHGPS